MNQQSKTVLILDDDTIVRLSFIAYFEDRCWEVLPAASAEEAIDLVKHHNPNGAIVDIRLPSVDGNEFLRHVGKHKPDISCIVCTGSPEYVFPEDVAALPNVSKKVFIKPVHDLPTLEATLEKLIAGKNNP